MNQLSDYITESIIIAERIRIDNLKKFELPINLPIEKMVDYLKDHNFEEISSTDQDMDIIEMRSLFSMAKHNAYMFDDYPNYKVLRFTHYPGRPLSKDDPIFNVYYRPGSGKPEYHIECKMFWETGLNKDDFIKKIDEEFNQ